MKGYRGQEEQHRLAPYERSREAIGEATASAAVVTPVLKGFIERR